MKNIFLFDLDGTLTDPGTGITNSVAYALDKYGIQIEDRTVLYPFIGPPLRESFMIFYGFSEEKAEEAVWKYREYFSDKGLFENEVYPGIKEMLGGLKNAGARLFVATSKPTGYSKQILDHFELSEYFEDIQGSTMDGSREKKADVIAYLLNVNHIQEKKEVIMIGDRRQDIDGAKENGLDSCGVLYGYGGREELEEAQADYIAEDVEKLGKILAELMNS